MWKIIKKSTESVVVNKKKFQLWMKGKFVIEFASDSFWPYDYKFAREDCYFSDWLSDRGTKMFPLLGEKFSNTEIFLETDDIVIATWERWWLMSEWKSFIDIINLKTEKKYRVFSREVNLIYNTKNSIIINYIDKWEPETLELDIETLEVKKHEKEWLYAFFKCIYSSTTKKWYLLDFTPNDIDESDIDKKYKSWTFALIELKLIWEPKSFDRTKFIVDTSEGEIDIWNASIQ